MAILSTIKVLVSGKEAQRELGKLEGRFEKTASKARRSFQGVGKSLSGMLVGGGIVASLKAINDELNELHNLSNRLNVSTQFLQQLQIAAEKVGLGADEWVIGRQPLLLEDL